MPEAQAFLGAAAARGLTFYTGVPCSFLTPLMNAVISAPETQYVGAANEGEAVGIAAGAWLAGRDAAVMFQNSGLGNAVNPLTSLTWSFGIPLLVIVTWRGAPGLGDEPQHALMGQITGGMLDVMRVPHAPFPGEDAAIGPALETAFARMEADALPYALVLEKGTLAKSPLDQPARAVPARAPIAGFGGTDAPAMDRMEALRALRDSLGPQTGIIATTGYTGRALFALGDAPSQFYVVGSMGCASAIGLGAALNTDGEIAVLDGDGAALMHLGNLATIGAEAPPNLTHILMDNGQHESTGGQQTVSPNVDFAAMAAAAGYARVARCFDAAALPAALAHLRAGPGPRFLHLKVAPGVDTPLPRPDVTPPEVARRFRRFLQEARDGHD